MQKKYATTKKVDPNEVQSLVSRMATDAHDVVDTTMNLVENTPATAKTLANLGFATPASDSAPESAPESGDEPPRPSA